MILTFHTIINHLLQANHVVNKQLVHIWNVTKEEGEEEEEEEEEGGILIMQLQYILQWLVSIRVIQHTGVK